MPQRIADDEQRRDRPQPPCALRVPAACRHLRRCRSSTMLFGIACVAAPGIWRHGARNAAHAITRTGSSDGGRIRAMSDISRRQFFGTATAAALGAGAGVSPTLEEASAQGRIEVPPQVEQTLALVNGSIHTMDGRNTVARAVTIRNGRFITVGDSVPRGIPNVRTIDLAGRTVVPGLIEPHVHIVSLANRPGYHTILENTNSIREIQDTLAARRKEVPAGQWITSMGGWHPNQWSERRRPTRRELDEAVSDRPVLLYERFTGPAVTNSLGKKLFDEWDAAAPVHPEIKKVAVADDGTIAPAGFAGGGPAASALYHMRRMQTFEDKLRSTTDAMTYSTAVGLTAHLDQVLFPTPGPLHPNQILSNLDQYRMYDSWQAVHRSGKATVRDRKSV